MDLKLKGKTAVVTGSTASIGLSIAEELTREGVKVFVAGRTQPKVDEALKVVRTAGEAEGWSRTQARPRGARHSSNRCRRWTSW